MKPKSQTRRVLWGIVGIASIIVVVLAGTWFVQRARADTDPEMDPIATAFVGDLSTRASASGQLLPQRQAQLALGVPGQVQEVLVEAGDYVEVGDILLRLDSKEFERAVRSAEQTLAIQEASLAELLKAPQPEDVAAAEAAVASAEARLQDLVAGPTEKELAQAEAAVASAQAQLADLLAGPSDEAVAQARAAVDSAQAVVRAAQERYEALDDQLVVADDAIHQAQLGKDRARDAYNILVWNDWKAGVSWAPYSPQGAAVKRAQIDYDIAVANRNLAEADINDSELRSAQAQLAQAEANLAALTEEKTVQTAAARAQLAQAEAALEALTEEKSAQIAAAEAQLAQAQARYQNLLDGPSEEQIAIARAQLEKTRVALEKARHDLAETTITAPFGGVVTQIYAREGEWASGLALELVDVESLDAVLEVDEVDMGSIALGLPAVVSLEAWPDREFSGQVVSIAPQAKENAGIVTYEIHLSIDPEGLPIRTGMTANADLITANLEDVLLVPNRAIVADRQAGKYYVKRVDGDEVTRVEVTIGSRDGNHTQITSGLEAGDKVSIKETEDTLDFTQGPPRGARELR